MRYVLLLLALAGAVDASLALREHYHVGTSPCDINAKWDCGTVNHSPYAVLGGIPVADIGIAGYLLLAVLAWKRKYGLMLGAAVPAMAFSLYLANIEQNVLGVWCVYCAISLGLICLLTVILIPTVIYLTMRRRRTASQPQETGVLSS